MEQLSAFTPEQIEQLTDQEAYEVLGALEVLHKQKRRENIIEYASYIEVPGTPSPASDSDRISILRKKEAMRRKADSRDWEDPEDEAFETADVPEEQFYPKQLSIQAHHALILNAVQALMEEEVVTGDLANGHKGIVPEGVMLFMPPGSAKSSYGSVVAPSYVMGRWPGTDVIGVSYASDLAKRFGRRVRHICRSAKYGETFEHKGEPVTVVGDNSAVDQWSLTNGSTYRAVGILGGVTGNRADLLSIDDPIAGREEAESEVIRDKTNAAVKDDLFTRLKPFGKILMTLTRWQEDDPAGHLLGEDWEGQSGLWKGTDGRWWLVLCCPLLCDAVDDPLGREIGERLWPEWFTDRFVQLARDAGERTWTSLYQQKPSASEGVIMLKKYWKCWQPLSRLNHGKPDPDPQLVIEENEPPKNWTQCILVYDTAIEDGEDNDYSAMTAWAAFPNASKGLRKLGDKQPSEIQNLILLGSWRAKVQAVDLLKFVEQHVEFFKPDHIVVEKKASGHQLLQELHRKRPRYTDLGQVHYVAIHEWTSPFPPGAKGKTPRAHSAALALEQGTVWYMPNAMNLVTIKECGAAPNGKYLDLFDTVTSMIIWSRTINLLEVPDDLLELVEEETVEREQRSFDLEPRPMYGHMRSKPISAAARSLYGRSSRPGKHLDG